MVFLLLKRYNSSFEIGRFDHLANFAEYEHEPGVNVV